MKKRIFFVLSLLIFIYCSKKEKAEIESNNIKDSKPIVYIFYSYPAFYSGFEFKMNVKLKKITAYIDYDYSLADSISKNTWNFIDSTDIKSIEKFLPKPLTFVAQFDKTLFTELESTLYKLSQFKTDKFPPEDGIYISIETENSKNVKLKKEFYTLQQNSEQQKLVLKTYEVIAKIFFNQTKLEDAIENSHRYFTNTFFIVKSKKPLYIKFLSDNCRVLESSIFDFPDEEKIFVDLTNYSGNKNDCLERIIRKKYSKVKWILRKGENYGFAEE